MRTGREVVDTIFQLALQPFIGWVFDRFGFTTAAVILCASYVFGFGGLALAYGPVAVLFTLPFISLAMSNNLVLLPLFVGMVTPREQFPIAYSLVQMVYQIGAAVATVVWTLVVDLTGTFTPALVGGMIAGVIGLTIVTLAVRRRRRVTAVGAPVDSVPVPVSS